MMTREKDYTIGNDAFEFFFQLLGVFGHYAFFTKKLWKKVEGFEHKDEAEVKCAFMSLWANQHLGIHTYPVGAAWCNYQGDRESFDAYIQEWKPVFTAYSDWYYKQR